MDVLMKCGHTAQGRDDNNNPVCLICMCEEVGSEKPNLDGRTAQCIYNCGHKTASSFRLPFFKYNMDSEYDAYYCGCFGWD